MECMSAMNCNSYKDTINTGGLPQLDSLTYEGTFNSNYIRIDKRLDIQGKDTLDLDYSTFVIENSITKQEEHYISVVIKSKYDGIGARKPIDLVFVLDKSGSMDSRLGSCRDSCISLAKKCIFKLIDNMLPEDRFSLVNVDNTGTTVFEMKDIDYLKSESVRNQIENISAGGGTDLNAGFLEALKSFESNSNSSNSNSSNSSDSSTSINSSSISNSNSSNSSNSNSNSSSSTYV